MPNVQLLRHRRIALVLGGGGLKGFAHIGVLRALEERDVRPAMYAGTSIGALLASAYLTGLGARELAGHARRLRRRDLFRVNHVGMVVERLRAPALYLDWPLRHLTESVVPHVRFSELATPLLVNTVDIERATQVVWGLPGHRDVHLDDAVYASCALPGIFPPGLVGERVCVDGGTIDNLPVSVVAPHVDAIIAVDVGSSHIAPDEAIIHSGFASIYMRAATVMMRALQETSLSHWSGPPMLLVRPRIAHIPWFRFGAADELIELGYQAACEALDDLETCLRSSGGIYPRQVMQLSVDGARCNGCGFCITQGAPFMALDRNGKAFPRRSMVDWSPADGDFVRHCPAGAIEARRITPLLREATGHPAA